MNTGIEMVFIPLHEPSPNVSTQFRVRLTPDLWLSLQYFFRTVCNLVTSTTFAAISYISNIFSLFVATAFVLVIFAFAFDTNWTLRVFNGKKVSKTHFISKAFWRHVVRLYLSLCAGSFSCEVCSTVGKGFDRIV